MQPVLATLIAAAALFAGTNVDDMILLAVLHAARRAGGRPRAWQIYLGQAVGVAALVVICLLAARGVKLLPAGWTRLLGLIPIGFGLQKLVVALRASGSAGSAPGATGLPAVIGLTLAGGGDNVAAYTPVFASLGPGDMALTLGVFAVATPLWCLVGSVLVADHRITAAIARGGRWLLPLVFIAIGLYLLAKADVVPV